jgi:hypothetical protein
LPDRKNPVLISDLTGASTTHELLYKLFASETGLLSVAHPETQYAAVVEVMQTLRARILERLADSAELDFFSGDHAYLGKLVIPLKVDAQLFVELYKDLNRFDGAQTLLSRHVYPLAGRMIAGNAQLQEFVLAQLQHHIIQYQAAVAHRIFETLIRFDLSTLVPQLKAFLPNVPTTTLQKTVPIQ